MAFFFLNWKGFVVMQMNFKPSTTLYIKCSGRRMLTPPQCSQHSSNCHDKDRGPAAAEAQVCLSYWKQKFKGITGAARRPLPRLYAPMPPQFRFVLCLLGHLACRVSWQMYGLPMRSGRTTSTSVAKADSPVEKSPMEAWARCPRGACRTLFMDAGNRSSRVQIF